MPDALPHHRVPPGLLMVMRRDDVQKLARWNAELDTVPDPLLASSMAAVVFGAETIEDVATLRHSMAVEQWRFNQATHEAIIDGGGRRHPDGGYIGVLASEDVAVIWNWHFPQGRRECPDTGTCHHECGPLAGCWRVSYTGPLSAHGETWTRAERIAHERPGGTI